MVFALPQNTNGVSRFLAAVVRCKRCYPYAWPVRATWLSLWRLFGPPNPLQPKPPPPNALFLGLFPFLGRVEWRDLSGTRQLAAAANQVLLGSRARSLHGCLVLEISTHDIFAFHMDISVLCACSLFLRVSTNF